MALAVDNRTIQLNGTTFDGKAVVDTVTKEIFLPVSLLAETGALVQSSSSGIRIDRLPVVSVVNHGNQTQVVRVPGSSKFDTGTRSTPIQQTDAQGNELVLNATVTNGKLTDLSGTLNFANDNVTADITLKFENGALKPSGQISVTSGAFVVSISAAPEGFSGSLNYKAGGTEISLMVQAGNNKPATIGLSITVHF